MNKTRNKEKLQLRLAKKICEPYMTSVLYACYQTSNNARDTFEEYCIKVNEKLKGESEEVC